MTIRRFWRLLALLSVACSSSERCVDLLVWLVALAFLAPLFAAVSVLVRVTSKGPILFRQTRIGMNQRKFTIYKFRTMVADAEKIQNELISMNEMTGQEYQDQGGNSKNYALGQSVTKNEHR